MIKDKDKYDTGSTAAVRKETRRWKLVQERNNAELETLVDTAAGAYLIWRILQEAGVYNVAGTLEPQQLAFHEGRRSLGLWLMAELTGIDEKLYNKVRFVGSGRDNG